MDKQTFWKIIDDTNSSLGQTSRRKFLNGISEKLMNYTTKEINDWKNILDYYHGLAYRQELWAACAAMGTHYTDDGFAYFRVWLISKGHDVFMKAIHDPDSLAEVDITDNETEFEEFWYVANHVYEKKKLYECLDSKQIKNLYENWMKDEGKKIAAEYSKICSTDCELDEFLEEHFICTESLRRKLDDDFEYKLPNENVIKDILEEIHLGKDIDSSWTCADLEKIVPGLFAKYNVSMRMQ